MKFPYDAKGGNTVQGWIKRFGRSELLNGTVYVKLKGETDELKRLESESKRLKIVSGETILLQQYLKRLTVVVNSHYQIGVKRDFGELQKN